MSRFLLSLDEILLTNGATNTESMHLIRRWRFMEPARHLALPPTRPTFDSGSVRTECLRQVCLLHIGNSLAGVLGAIIVVVALFAQVHHAPAYLWVLGVAVAGVHVRIRALRFGKVLDSPNGDHIDGPRRWFLASYAVEGLAWSMAPFMLHVREQRYEFFVISTMLAVSFVSSLALSPYVPAAVAFTVPVNGMLMIWLVGQGGHWGWSAASGVAVIYAITLAYVRSANDVLRTAVRGRLQNAHLIEELQAERVRTDATNSELQLRNDQLKEIARRDPLTGLYNRRHFAEWMENLRMQDKPWFLAILDVDHFKMVNDQYGHQAGDRVLVAIARAANNELRWTDCLARMGGEEFGLLLQASRIEDAILVVERVRATVAAVNLGMPPVTMSVGLVEGTSNMDPSVALAEADQALYEAKRTGRDRLVCFPFVSSASSQNAVSVAPVAAR